MPDPIPDPEPLPHEEDDEGTEHEDEDEEAYYDDDDDEEDEEEVEEDDDDYETEFEDEEINYDDEEGHEDEDYDETEDEELDQQNVQQPHVPQVSRTHNTVALESSSSPSIVAPEEEEATNERGRQDREAPPSSSISVESSEWNRSEIDGLFCPICMEAWTNEGDHQICCLPCGHIYGMSCIKMWLELRKKSAKCPQCNQRCTLQGVRKLYASRLVTVDEGLHKIIQYLEAKCAALEQQLMKAHGMRWTINEKERDLPLIRATGSTQPPPASVDQIMNHLANLSTSLSQIVDQMRQEQRQTLERMDKMVEEMDKMKLGQGQILERMDKIEQEQASHRGMIHDISRYIYGIYQNQGWSYPPAYDFPPPDFYPPLPPPDIPYPYPPPPPPSPSDA